MEPHGNLLPTLQVEEQACANAAQYRIPFCPVIHQNTCFAFQQVREVFPRNLATGTAVYQYIVGKGKHAQDETFSPLPIMLSSVHQK